MANHKPHKTHAHASTNVDGHPYDVSRAAPAEHDMTQNIIILWVSQRDRQPTFTSRQRKHTRYKS